MAEPEPGHPDALVERLTNWLDQANDGTGSLPPGVTPTQWAVRNFIDTWRAPVRVGLDSAEASLRRALDLLLSGDPTRAAVEIGTALQTLAEDVRDPLGIHEWNREPWPPPEDSAVQEQIRAEIATLDGRHGLTRENLSPYLVEPYRVTVRHGRRLVPMWVVAHEQPAHPHEGNLVAFYPERNEWCLVQIQDGDYVCGVEGERSLAAAWIDM